MHINAAGVYYRQLNEMIRQAMKAGAKEVYLEGVNGQYYIGSGLRGQVKIVIYGVPGNDLGAFMDGPTIIVKGNGQDNIGNTMNSGRIVVHGHAGDVLGYGMRGGQLLVKEEVGYRVGIHMKGYKGQVPALVVGGCAGDFLGEYMAGGILMVLGLNSSSQLGGKVGDYLGTGMHGGVIYVRGQVDRHQCGKEVGVELIEPNDDPVVKELTAEFCQEFGLSLERVLAEPFSRITPVSSRPYGSLYAY